MECAAGSCLARRVPVIERFGLALVPYFPLASGLLTGKYRRGQPMPTGTRLSDPRFSTRFANEQNFEVVERLAAFCAQRGRTMLELAFGWLLARPYVASVIAARPRLSRCGRTRARSAGS
jgi:aryl-alcohol dehydrogenase-like predicted oxidoreductase